MKLVKPSESAEADLAIVGHNGTKTAILEIHSTGHYVLLLEDGDEIEFNGLVDPFVGLKKMEGFLNV